MADTMTSTRGADILGTEHALSGNVWLTAVTSLGKTLFEEAGLELYGDSSTTRILYRNAACEGAYLVAQFAARGAIVVLPEYTIYGREDGLALLRDLG